MFSTWTMYSAVLSPAPAQSSMTLCQPFYRQMVILVYHLAARQLLLPLVWVAVVVLLVQTAFGTVGPPCWWGLLCTCERGYHITIHTYTRQHCASTKNSMCSINNNKKRLLKYLWQSRNVVIHRLSSRMFLTNDNNISVNYFVGHRGM